MTASASSSPPLGMGFAFADLYDEAGLARLDAAFLDRLETDDADLAERLRAARGAPNSLGRRDEAELLLALGPHLDAFLGKLFPIAADLAQASAAQQALEPLFAAKRLFVQRIALKRHKPDEAAGFDGPALADRLAEAAGHRLDDETAFATQVMAWMADEAAHAEPLALAARYAAWAAHTPAGRAAHADGVLFRQPGRNDDAEKLVATVTTEVDGLPALVAPPEAVHGRDGFALTDSGCDLTGGLNEMHYCIHCHAQGKDSCAVGLKDRKTGAIQVNPLGREMLGCPLEERISEFQKAKTLGLLIAPLALIAIDNPMAAGTGHRICNDCMVACVYQNQKRDPVNIPQAETRTLKDVLELPWGFEIYSLLTRWNPLNLARPLPRPDSGRSVLVAGMGPAGYTLAHHLLNEGHWVAGIEGLKLEPLPAELSGVEVDGRRVPFRPLIHIADLQQPLDQRLVGGFGGVAEYGITVRWDKTFLAVIRLLLERRARFSLYGGVRLGGTLTVDEAFEAGFDHIALCLGAGRPTLIPMENGLAPGVRQASDFLMALQLGGAARPDSIANLQLRLPVAVIGGGLTAIDACTEALAYYPVQVEKYLTRHEALAAEKGEAAVLEALTPAERHVAEEWLDHARQLRGERARAKAAGEKPRLRELLDSWGGASVVYRKRLIDSPAYRNNPEEVTHALAEGIRFIEQGSPLAVEVDGDGQAEALLVDHPSGKHRLAARAIIVAAGTVPNVTLARETPGLTLDGRFFQAIEADGTPVAPERRVKPAQPHVLTHRRADGRGISFFGDQHPSFAGNVVSAMASAKQGYPVISALLAETPPAGEPTALRARLESDLRASVHAVNRLTPTIVEVVVKAPAAARHFQPGQFYRLQNLESLAPMVGQGPSATRLAMEGLALTGAAVDAEAGLLSLIVLEMGGSSDLCRLLKPGEPLVVMGPTGTPTHIPENETVLLAGGGLGNAVLFSIGRAMRQAGCKVLYFAGYRRPEDRYKVADILAASDTVVWCSDTEAPEFTPERPGDKVFIGNIVKAMEAYGAGQLGPVDIPLSAVDRIIAIGSDRMMAAVAEARHGVLAPYLKAGHLAIGSINSPMQCMLKEICAQCLQTHIDPETGEKSVVFSCYNQDQPLDHVDFPGLAQRLSQNTTAEKQTKAWLARCLHAVG
ncbi:FAD-dependent oxidoreductase [Roseospirillum parvum]|uniref:NADPH-dependent glutamate synthase beta chain n=1 Tax=Roseospirillum parvum TaxID=83401 RepID=A0A1G8BQI6_9PROT|nr:FAD-dependent oxidoreductase [Roseospirillum parvum]SDH35419.1 NADPH-dependent glutamate synthase beta chain [Roseospirillum parvum]